MYLGRVVRRGVVVAVLSLIVGVAAAGPAYGQDDAEVVFCLAPGRHEALRHAAQALDVRVPDDEAGLRTWARDRPADFQRVCSALFESQRPRRPGVGTSLLPFLTALVGAVLAFGAATWRERIERGRLEGDRLRTAVEEFCEACETYVRSWSAGRSDAEVVRTRRALLNQLADVKARRAAWSTVTIVREQLTSGVLGRAISLGWDNDREKTRDRVITIESALAEVQQAVLLVAHALATPARSLFRLRRPGASTS